MEHTFLNKQASSCLVEAKQNVPAFGLQYSSSESRTVLTCQVRHACFAVNDEGLLDLKPRQTSISLAPLLTLKP